MAVLLYYPLVKPPTEIIHQALLYWDGIASVVPAVPAVYAAAVTPELEELRDLALYTPLSFHPRSLDSYLDDPEFGAAGLPRSAARVLWQELHRMAASPRPPRVASPPNAFIYASKFNLWLERELLDLGLAERPGPGFYSLAVPKEVQHLIIGVLARELAAESRVSYVPYTDREDAHTWALRAPTDDRLSAWEVELGRLLPVPAPGTATADVLAFRERYADERERLMRALHRMLGELRRDYKHPADVMARLRREIALSVEDYRAAVKSSRMAWVNRSVTVTIALAAAAGSVAQPGFTWILGAVGGYTLNVATREIRPVSRARKDHDFSYLHRVEKTLA